MCDEYGIDITDEHIESVKAIANENGEVRNKQSFECKRHKEKFLG